MENRFTQLLSYLLHPILLPLVCTFYFLFRPDLYNIQMRWIDYIFIISVVTSFSFLLPAIFLMILYKRNQVQSIEVKERTERITPLIITIVFYVGMIFLLRKSPAPALLLYMLTAATVSLITGLIIHFFYKISLHAIGWASFASALFFLNVLLQNSILPLVIIAIILSGVAGYARLKQNAHNAAQVYWGYVAGIASVIIMTLFY